MSVDGRSFVDTNTLVYAHDTSAGPKREVATALVEDLWESGHGCVSIQVLQELFVTLTRKLPRPVDTDTAEKAVEDFSTWTVHVPGADDVIAAIQLHNRNRISFWDAMIVRSAVALGCDTLLSEDLNAGQRYDGVLVVDPFA
ncbi:MAG: PIN domain-containing protein [Gaiella sp.]|nr:PIN domain-containing protein [Gaiella sp.]